jgi:hypothetical protein
VSPLASRRLDLETEALNYQSTLRTWEANLDSSVVSTLKKFIAEAETRLHRAAVAYAVAYDETLKRRRKLIRAVKW